MYVTASNPAYINCRRTEEEKKFLHRMIMKQRKSNMEREQKMRKDSNLYEDDQEIQQVKKLYSRKHVQSKFDHQSSIQEN